MSDGPKLPAHPNLEWLRKAAKRRLEELRRTAPDTKLAEAQLEIARRHGFPSWRKLVAFVDAVDARGDELRAAVRAGDVSAVTAILDERPELVNVREDLLERERPSDEPGMSLLHLAVAEGRAAIAELLVARGAPLDARNRGGRTALHDCFELGRVDIARMLIDRGAAVDACAAAAYGDHDRLEAILRADPDRANDLTTGLSPLGWAGYARDARSAEILLAHGAIIDRSPYDSEAWGPASELGAVAVIEVLLAHGADPSCADRRGRTPLHIAITSRLVQDPTEIVRVLLEAGADPTRPDHVGRSALDDAVARLAEARESGADPAKRSVGTQRLEIAIDLMRRARARA